MKTTMSETEVNRVPLDAVNLSLPKLPYDGQDEKDRTMAEHFLLKGIAGKVNGRLKKLDDAVKDIFPEDQASYVAMTKNWRLEATKGTPREQFDLDGFLELLVTTYPNLMKHKLKELSGSCKKHTAPPVSIVVEYIGDVPRKAG